MGFIQQHAKLIAVAGVSAFVGFVAGRRRRASDNQK